MMFYMSLYYCTLFCIDVFCSWEKKRKKKEKKVKEKEKDNPEKLVTKGTQDEEKQDKNTTQ